MNTSEAGETGREAARSLLRWTFAFPGALPILGKLNDSLNLYPIVERLVLGYVELVHYFSEQASKFIPMDWDKVNVLFFLAFIGFHILASYSSGNERKNHPIWGFISGITIIFAAGSLGIYQQTQNAAGVVSIIIQIVLPAALIAGIMFFAARNRQVLRERKYFLLLTATVLVLGNTIFIAVANFDETFSPVTGSLGGIIFSAISQMIIYFSFALMIEARIRGPALIGVWVFGIFLVSWMRNTGMPYLENFADQIGI